ncbi:MAG: hypothetical protein WB992_04085 [Bryobacteraceae bacterium]
MYFFHLFRSFLPLRNPIGFGAADFIIFAISALLVSAVLSWPAVQPYAQRLAGRAAWCMLAVGMLPILLRLGLLIHNPVPAPSGSDDFGYLLLADTLAHFRLANPAHPMHRFFETIFVPQQPAYCPMFPLGQGLVLALGQLVFHNPWAGVLLSTGVFCALCYWMLRGWIRPAWALLGGVLAAFEFGPLSYWMNSYWGGAVSASAGCLVFGSLPRLCDSGRVCYAVLLGIGISIQLLTRPYELTLMLLSVILFLLFALRLTGEWRKLLRAAPVLVMAVVPAAVLTLLQNKAVTGSWTTLPYMLNRYEYGIPTTFTFQPNPVPHRELTPDQDLDYRAEAAIHGDAPETLSRFLKRVAERARFYRFFLVAPLYIGFIAFIVSVRTLRRIWILATLLIFVLGSNFFPYFYPHYIAAAACLFLLASIEGLERLNRLTRPSWLQGRYVARIVILLCTAHFLFWYGVHLLGGDDVASALSQYESWDFINYGDPEGRIAIDNRLAHAQGKQLVFVRYGPRHMFHNWIHNAADIDNSRVIWARDLGPAEDEQLRRYYPGRTAWLVEPDAMPPKITPFTSGNAAFEGVP